MKRVFLLIFFLCMLPGLLTAQNGIYQHGTVVRMHMGECIPLGHGFMATFGGPSAPIGPEPCPEYTLVADNVVFVIVGKLSNSLIPLAETIGFRFHKNEIAVRVDDAKREAKFAIKEMMVRSEWDRMQRHVDERMRDHDDHEAEVRLR
jgi:hypothetical protein